MHPSSHFYSVRSQVLGFVLKLASVSFSNISVGLGCLIIIIIFDTFKINFIIRFSRYGLCFRTLHYYSSVLPRSEIPVSKLPDFFARKTRLSGDGEIRTLDPLLARQVLSQLSYAPI